MANQLIKAKSPYLREAATQPIDWLEWSDQAFDKAQREDKPVLLSIGAIWCHWCHVMAQESFKNLEIAKIINENFIPIKLDRDERPEIDRRYQEAVMALTGSAGWPLTVFLTPDGQPFFGGTYFPPDDRHGRPGFKSILLSLARVWREDKTKITQSANNLLEIFEDYSSQNYRGPINLELLKKGISALLRSIDYQKGGFGQAPKFHHASALELLMDHDFFEPSDLTKKAVEISLEAMAKGGIYDHLLGGFFRYSTDEDWHEPHFEKLLSDNAELLKIYTLAYSIYKKEIYKEVAEGIVEYYKRYGFDQKGGFYASQDADIYLLGEGAYYKFSFEELKEILEEEELEVASLYFSFGLKEEGQKLPFEKTLYIAKSKEEISELLNLPSEKVTKIIRTAKEKMLRYREEKRPQPYIDKTIYTNWNALMVTALCEFWKIFRDNWSKMAAEKTVERLLEENYKDQLVYHSEEIEGVAEDYLFLSRALLSLFEITQKDYYLEKAIIIVRKAIDLFWDTRNHGFYDAFPKDKHGLLKVKMKNVQDTPIQSANGMAPLLLLLLSSLTPDTKLRDYAEKTLEAFASLVDRVPMISHSYLISLYAYLKGIFKIETNEFFDKALELFRPFKVVRKAQVEGIVVCEGNVCKRYKEFWPLINKLA
ncbi:MAG: thioredoxin domain-containing protein [Candidatus Aminicenantes bacterium]|nr:thioredoxin domain-containing protein [Candidatus Aminicenantes bacterium]